MKKVLIPILIFVAFHAYAQSPLDAQLPARLDSLSPMIQVDHYPSPVYASLDMDEEGIYFWKHNTTFMSPYKTLQLVEGGAYLYYNDKWNLRAAFNPKQISKWFDIPKGVLKAGQPYTFVNNWRTDTKLYGGWAMWYVIAEDESGKRFCGFGMLDTVGEMIEDQKFN